MTVRESHGISLSVAIRSDVGRVRTNNEDSHGFAWLDDGSLFVIVADGMGGHEAGEVASGLAVQVVEDVVRRDLDADPRECLYNGLLEANEAILDEGRASGTRGMGTTAIAGILRGPEVHVGQVGDSRLYHFRKGQLVWRTLDHTRVQMLIDNGEITDEESRTHPEAGMLTRALGHSRMADGRPLVPDVLAEPLTIEDNDTLVLCSDGLHDLLDDWEIAQMVAGLGPEQAAEVLVEEACNRGGHDNVTVAVIVAGERGQDYDPDFVPESWAVDDVDEELAHDPTAEVTFDELPPAMVPAPDVSTPEPAKRSSAMVLAMAVGIMLLVVGVMVMVGSLLAVGLTLVFGA